MVKSVFYPLLAAILSIVILFIITRLTGSRQISSLSVYEYVNSITLGSLAAQMALGEKESFLPSLVAVLVYGVFTVGCVFATDKSRRVRRFLNGSPVILMEHGKLSREGFTKTRMDVEEFCAHLRTMGYFDLSQVDGAVMETTGQISVLPKAAQRPLTPADAKLPVTAQRICRAFIVDGFPLTDTLSAAGHDTEWLSYQLRLQGIDSPSDVFLGCEDMNGNPIFYRFSPAGDRPNQPDGEDREENR